MQQQLQATEGSKIDLNKKNFEKHIREKVFLPLT
jgi:hypothetical protein